MTTQLSRDNKRLERNIQRLRKVQRDNAILVHLIREHQAEHLRALRRMERRR